MPYLAHLAGNAPFCSYYSFCFLLSSLHVCQSPVPQWLSTEQMLCCASSKAHSIAAVLQAAAKASCSKVILTGSDCTFSSVNLSKHCKSTFRSGAASIILILPYPVPPKPLPPISCRPVVPIGTLRGLKAEPIPPREGSPQGACACWLAEMFTSSSSSSSFAAPSCCYYSDMSVLCR